MVYVLARLVKVGKAQRKETQIVEEISRAMLESVV